MMQELIGFAPDAEPRTPGIMTDCQNIVPFEKGFRSAPLPQAVGLPALAGECRGSAVVRDLTNNARLFAGTATKLYEAASTSWTDISAGGGTYSLGSEDRWSFCQFGNSSIAATPTKKIQLSTSGAFAEITGAPNAYIVESATNFVLAFHTSDATYGDQPDRWWCCALYDATSWTPSVATQATTGRILDGQGGFTAAKRFGSDVVAYKERGVFVGRYAGAPVVWQWTPVSEDVGCVGPEAVAVTSIGHVFVGSDNIYLFDGTRPVPLATDTVRQWWLDNSSAQYRGRTKLLWDRFSNLVWIYFPSATSSGLADYCLVFHVLTKRWGRADTSVEAVLTYISNGGVTFDGTSSTIVDFETGPTFTFDSVRWLNQSESPAVFTSAHQLQTLTAASSSSSFTTGEIGDAVEATMCTGVRLQSSTISDIVDCYGFTKKTAGANAVQRIVAELNDGSFDIRQTSRYHYFRFDFSGDNRFSAMEVDLLPAGRR
jgi:hypothetical protein